MKDLTERQNEIFRFIHGNLTIKGLAPTVQEIQREFGFGSPNAVQTHLTALEKKGFIQRLERQARGLRLTTAGRKRGGKSNGINTTPPMKIGGNLTSPKVAGVAFRSSSYEYDGRTSVSNDVQPPTEFSGQTVSQTDPADSRTIGKILVIDDEDDIRFVVATRLQRAGYTTISAADGHEGLRRFYSDRPDLVVLDVGMPEMDGWQVLERIREVSNLPVFMLTALGQERDKVRGLRGGADDYITKPFSGEELLARVESALRRANASSEIDGRPQTSQYHDNGKIPASEMTGLVDQDHPAPAAQLSAATFALEAAFHARHAIAAELDGETHLHYWEMRAHVQIAGGLIGSAGELQKIYVRRLIQEIADEIEGTVLNQLDLFAALEPTPERLVTWIGFKAEQELEMVGVQLNYITLQDMGVVNLDGTIRDGNHPMLKMDFQDSGSGVSQVYDARSLNSLNGAQLQLDGPMERENIEQSEQPSNDQPDSEGEPSTEGAVETPSQSTASKDTHAVTEDSRIVQPAQLSEMGIDVFFNAKHILSKEFDGEIHAHSWRLRAVVLMANDRDDPSAGIENLRDSLQEVVDEIEGVVLNGIDQFRTVEPTPERLVAWLSPKIRQKLNTPSLQLRSTTLWDHPTQYVTTWEEVDFRAA